MPSHWHAHALPRFLTLHGMHGDPQRKKKGAGLLPDVDDGAVGRDVTPDMLSSFSSRPSSNSSTSSRLEALQTSWRGAQEGEKLCAVRDELHKQHRVLYEQREQLRIQVHQLEIQQQALKTKEMQCSLEGNRLTQEFAAKQRELEAEVQRQKQAHAQKERQRVIERKDEKQEVQVLMAELEAALSSHKLEADSSKEALAKSQGQWTVRVEAAEKAMLHAQAQVEESRESCRAWEERCASMEAADRLWQAERVRLLMRLQTCEEERAQEKALTTALEGELQEELVSARSTITRMHQVRVSIEKEVTDNERLRQAAWEDEQKVARAAREAQEEAARNKMLGWEHEKIALGKERRSLQVELQTARDREQKAREQAARVRASAAQEQELVSTGMEEALANVVRLEATVLRAAAAVIQV